MDIATAKQAVAALRTARPAFGKDEEARALTLLADPDAVNQAYYGTCGMAAVVRSFLQQDRSRFVDLLRAVYADEPFNGIPTNPGVLLGTRLDQRAKKEAHYAGEYLTTWDLDFVLSRSVGKLLKLRSPDMYEAQKLFSEEIARLFNAKKPYLPAFTLGAEHAATLDAEVVDDDLRFELEIKSWRVKEVAGFGIDQERLEVLLVTRGSEWAMLYQAGGRERVLRVLRAPTGELQVDVHVADSESALRDEGDLALDADGLAYVAQKVAGAPTATITRVRPGRVPAAVATVNAQLAGRTPYVYAFIRSYAAWLTACEDPRARTFTGPPTPPEPIWGRTAPEGEHIIAINGAIRAEGAEYAVPVWTWATAFEVRIPADQMAGYLPIYVHGSLG